METAARVGNSGSNSSQSHDQAGADAAAIKEAAIDAASSVNSLYHASHSLLERQAKERPYVVLGAAAGIGFILGGGLASRLAGILLAAGGRMLASQLVGASLNERDDASPEF